MTEGGREAGKRRKGNELDKESQRQAEMFKGALKRGKRKKIAKKERNYGEIGRKMREGLRREERQDRRGVVKKGEEKVHPLGTSHSGLGTGLTELEADEQPGGPPHTPGSRVGPAAPTAQGERLSAPRWGGRARGEPRVRPAAPPPPRPPPSRGFSCRAQEAGLAPPRTIARGRHSAPGEAGAELRGKEASALPGVGREPPARAAASVQLGAARVIVGRD